MRNQKLLIPKEMLNYSYEKFECQLQKTLTKLTITLDKLLIKTESVTAISKEHNSTKTEAKIA